MAKKANINEMIKNLTETNAFEVLTVLSKMYNEEGKNAVLVALDKKLYDKVEIMLKPIKKPNKDEYVLFFNPYKNGVSNGTKPLKWPSVPPKMQYLADYTGILDTKDTFYDFYSIYSYIECMDNKTAKEYFKHLITSIPHELFNKMNVSELPSQIENRTSIIYKPEDIVKYYPLPYISFITELYNKGIDAKTTFNNYCGEIIIESGSLSPENKRVAEKLIKKGLMSINDGILIINLKFNNQTKISDIESYLSIISELFIPQHPTYEKININHYYLYVKEIMKRYGVVLPTNPDEEEKIKLCRKYNRQLTLDVSGTFFYLHPGIKERIEGIKGIKL